MIVLYSAIAIFIAWIWVDYYRLIDIYGKENLFYFVLVFLMGAGSVFIVLGLEDLFLGQIPFHLNGGFFNDFAYCVLRIGLVEEFAKMIPFLILLVVFPRRFDDPIDYLTFICISALGFSAAENVLYFLNHGAGIINGRAVLSTISHMFNTALIAYGILLYKYRKDRMTFWNIPLFFFLAGLSHGFYDFWLVYDGLGGIGFFITAAYFMITISWFAVILNNALNNSQFFTYKKVINSGKVAERMILYYGIVFAVQFILLYFFPDPAQNMNAANLVFSFLMTGFIVLVASVRLSRFKLIKGRWFRFKIELPFSIAANDSYAEGYLSFGSLQIKVKGESYNEAHISPYYHEYFYLLPTDPDNSKIKTRKLAYIVSKVFLKGDNSYYKARLYKDDEDTKFALILLRPKTKKPYLFEEKYPVVAILRHDKEYDLLHNRTGKKKYRFVEWAYIMEK